MEFVVQTSDRLSNLRSKLSQLERLDSARRIFGSKPPVGHGYLRQPCLTTDQLSQLERSFGIQLPTELRVLLSQVLGGGAGPGYGFSVTADRSTLARRAKPFPFADEDAARVIAARRSRSDPWSSLELPAVDENDEDDDDWPPGPGFIPLAHHGCGVTSVVVASGVQRGLVWCCDMRWCPEFDSDGRQLGVLDWYEDWLDRSLSELSKS